MKKHKTDRYLLSMEISFFVALCGAVVALCVKHIIPAAISAAGWVAFVVAYIVAVKKTKDKSYFEQSMAAVVASIILTALSPIAFVLWLVELTVEKIHDKRAEKL